MKQKKYIIAEIHYDYENTTKSVFVYETHTKRHMTHNI